MKRNISIDKLEEELEASEHLKSNIINQEIKCRYTNRNIAQKLTAIEWYNKYGKQDNLQTGNTYKGKHIEQTKPLNFGSIDDYNIDTLPKGLFHCKGTEITQVKEIDYRKKKLINRRFLSNILQTWCYFMGIKYIDNTDKYEFTGTKLWGKELEYSINLKDKSAIFLTGKQGKQMIRDIIFLSRNKRLSKMKDYIENKKVSPQMYRTILYRVHSEKKTFDEILQDIKSRVFYDYSIGEYAWAYPKYNIEYLTRTLRELSTEKYFLSILIPIIEHLRKYPIICKDTHVFPKSDEEHNKAKDDYDISQHIWER